MNHDVPGILVVVKYEREQSEVVLLVKGGRRVMNCVIVLVPAILESDVLLQIFGAGGMGCEVIIVVLNTVMYVMLGPTLDRVASEMPRLGCILDDDNVVEGTGTLKPLSLFDPNKEDCSVNCEFAERAAGRLGFGAPQLRSSMRGLCESVSIRPQSAFWSGVESFSSSYQKVVYLLKTTHPTSVQNFSSSSIPATAAPCCSVSVDGQPISAIHTGLLPACCLTSSREH